GNCIYTPPLPKWGTPRTANTPRQISIASDRWETFSWRQLQVNPSDTPPELTEDNREQYFMEYVPIKFGSALRSKLLKCYWDLPHVHGKPLVIAIQDFHAHGA